MKPLCIILAAVFAVVTVNAAPKKKKESGFTKILRTMFPSTKPKVVRAKPRRVQPSPKPTPKSKHITVEPYWMARYWEEEAAWDYYIPEDDQIRFENGRYLVPISVYRHYEDMVNTPRRSPTPMPISTFE